MTYEYDGPAAARQARIMRQSGRTNMTDQDAEERAKREAAYLSQRGANYDSVLASRRVYWLAVAAAINDKEK